MSFSKPIDFDKGADIWCRFRILVDSSHQNPELILEGLVLQEGQMFETLPMETKKKLERGCSKAIYLW